MEAMKISNAGRAQILVQALPYIQRLAGKTIVVKYGGNAMINEELKNAVMNDIVMMKALGINVVLVHGGGPEINAMLKKVGKESRFVNGMRYTDEETMDIVQQVLAGKVNKALVQLLEQIHHQPDDEGTQHRFPATETEREQQHPQHIHIRDDIAAQHHVVEHHHLKQQQHHEEQNGAEGLLNHRTGELLAIRLCICNAGCTHGARQPSRPPNAPGCRKSRSHRPLRPPRPYRRAALRGTRSSAGR